MIVKTFTGLKVLSLSGCYMLSESSFLAISEFLKNLQVLHIAFCDGFSNSCASHLANMKQLTSLDMKMCSASLTEESFLLLTENLINLQYLNLYRNKNISDAVLSNIAKYLLRLKELILTTVLN